MRAIAQKHVLRTELIVNEQDETGSCVRGCETCIYAAESGERAKQARRLQGSRADLKWT